MNPTFGRRALLGGAAAGALTVATGPQALAHGPGHGHSPAPGFWNKPSKLNTPDRVFLERGLMHGAWVRHDNDGWFPNAKLWKGAGFTTPQFYKEATAAASSKTLEYGEGVMKGPNHDSWALARAPFGDNLNGVLPDPDADWLTPKMLANVKDLFSVCFGDEEVYSPALTAYLAGAIAHLREKYPWVLTHNNQTLGQYPDPDLITYARTAKPDLLTWDWYPWHRSNTYAGGSVSGMYRQVERYRRISQAGADGTGSSPMAFGQYTTGFRLQPPGDFAVVRYQRRKHISESQLNLAPYLTWATGGKWLSLFRWELDEDYQPWETDGLFLTDANEKPLPAYHRYARVNEDMRAFSPYLTRLRTRAVSRIGGLTETGAATAEITGMPTWTPAVDSTSGIVSVSAVNVGTANNGKRGDVVIGTFGELPDLSAGENKGILPDRDEASAFMIVNGMAVDNANPLDAYSTGGNGVDTRQAVTVTLDPSSVAAGTRARSLSLHRIDRRKGRPVAVPLRRVGDTLQFTTEIDGGAGELFIWG